MELMKIANDTEATYLDKVAAIVETFVDGEVSAQEADEFAAEIGINPADLLAFHDATYGAGGDMEKVASEENDTMETLAKIALDEDTTYIEKCAATADLFGMGIITDIEAGELAKEAGVDLDDVQAIFDAAYEDDIEKDAGVMSEAKKNVQNAAKKAGKYIKKDWKQTVSDVKAANRATIKGTGGTLNAGQKVDAIKRGAGKAAGKAKKFLKNNKGYVGAAAGAGTAGAGTYYATK